MKSLGSAKKLILLFAFSLGCTTPSSNAEEEKKLNSKINYIVDGQIVNGWTMQLGDPENWSVPVVDRNGKSASGKLTVEPADFQGKGDAIRFSWAPRKQVRASVALYGTALDLSPFENTGALVLDVKIEVKPDKNVSVSMDCGHPCRGEIEVGRNLANLKKGQWSSLPIALNCFTKAGLDIKKIYGPIVIATDGKLTMDVTNVRLQKLMEGDKGCAE